jgi:hypothetical protein
MEKTPMEKTLKEKMSHEIIPTQCTAFVESYTKPDFPCPMIVRR